MAAKEKPQNGVIETIKTIVYALLIAGVFRTLFFQPFWIPSGSMKETLLIGDFLFVNKMAYGYSYASCPSIPLIGLDAKAMCGFLDGDNTRILAGEPERGDVVVFRHPISGADYIKRLVGLPGDTVQVTDGILILNGTPVPQEPAGTFVEEFAPQGPQGLRPRCESGAVGQGAECTKSRFIESFPDGSTHVVLNVTNQGSDNTSVFRVPEGEYFFMGDNRDNSSDSRLAQLAGGVGFVPYENLIGRADRIVFSSAGRSMLFFWTWRGSDSSRGSNSLERCALLDRCRIGWHMSPDDTVGDCVRSCGGRMKLGADLAAFEARIGHQFTNPELLIEAVTHASMSSATRSDNQRLEFLGDRVLGLVMAEALLGADTSAPEGTLAPRFNALVRKETCADVAREIGLGDVLRLGRSEMMSGGRRKLALLGDAVEAVIAAVYLDGGFDAARALIVRLWADRIGRVEEDARDAKTALQEWAQGRGLAPPDYVETARKGPDHAPEFTIAARLVTGAEAIATARSKREAQQAAAKALLAQLEQDT